MAHVHRTFYASQKSPGEQPQGLAFADPVITTDGVLINWMDSSRRWTPVELRMLADWAHSLSSQTIKFAEQGLIHPGVTYDADSGKVESVKADN